MAGKNELDELKFVYETLRKYSQHEDELINNRLGWFLTLESILLAAHGYVLREVHYDVEMSRFVLVGVQITHAIKEIGNDNPVDLLYAMNWFLVIVAVGGLLIAFVVRKSVGDAHRALAGLRNIWDQYCEIYKSDAGPLNFIQVVKKWDTKYRPPLLGLFPYLQSGGFKTRVKEPYGASHMIPVIVMIVWVLLITVDLFYILHVEKYTHLELDYISYSFRRIFGLLSELLTQTHT